jgi:hypothetical protein
VRVVVPLVPVIVSGYEPGATLDVVEIASVDGPPPLTVDGVNVGVAPPGRPDTVRATSPLKPPVGVTFVVKLVPAPGATVWVAGVAEIA